MRPTTTTTQRVLLSLAVRTRTTASGIRRTRSASIALPARAFVTTTNSNGILSSNQFSSSSSLASTHYCQSKNKQALQPNTRPSFLQIHHHNHTQRRALHYFDSQQQPTRRMFFSALKDLFSAPTIASPEQLKAAFFNSDKVVVIDNRSAGEITHLVDCNSHAATWHHASGSPFDNGMVRQEAAGWIGPDKATPVICYCASGKRSQKAVNILTDELGYTNVLNGGGISNLQGVLPVVAAK